MSKDEEIFLEHVQPVNPRYFILSAKYDKSPKQRAQKKREMVIKKLAIRFYGYANVGFGDFGGVLFFISLVYRFSKARKQRDHE